MAIPGYKGFIPGDSNGSLIGARYTEITRKSLTKENMDDKEQMFSSTGYNLFYLSNLYLINSFFYQF
jgi:hypothetical protein